VQRLRTDNDRVKVKLVLLGIPAAVADPSVQLEQRNRVDAAAPGNPVLTIGGKRHVSGAERAAGSDLGGLLAKQRGPDAQLALALQGDRLGIDSPDQHQIAVHAADGIRVEVKGVVGMLDPLTLGCEELDQLRWCCGSTVLIDGHVPLLSVPALGSPHRPDGPRPPDIAFAEPPWSPYAR